MMVLRMVLMLVVAPATMVVVGASSPLKATAASGRAKWIRRRWRPQQSRGNHQRMTRPDRLNASISTTTVPFGRNRYVFFLWGVGRLCVGNRSSGVAFREDEPLGG